MINKIFPYLAQKLTQEDIENYPKHIFKKKKKLVKKVTTEQVKKLIKKPSMNSKDSFCKPSLRMNSIESSILEEGPSTN